MEGFHKKDESKHESERHVEIISKNSKRQQGFGNEEPHAIIEALEANFSKLLRYGKHKIQLTSISVIRSSPKKMA